MGHPAEAHFVVDHRQRIVQWSDAAAAMLGVPAAAAVGRPCPAVVRGRDPIGKPVCRFGCPAIRALQAGQISHASAIASAGPEGTNRLACRVLALPGPSREALVTLTEQEPLPFSGERSNIGGLWQSRSASPTETMRDLAVVGSLAANLPSSPPAQRAERALEWLRQTLDVEVAELFVREPHGQDLFLTHFCGRFRAAFSQITRFHAGEGFPGLVLTGERAILTTSLPGDERYMRSRVKEKGFHSYVCVPLRGADGVIGVLNVAARREDLDLERAQRILNWVGAPLSGALETTLLRARLGAVAGVAPGDGFDERLKSILQRMMNVGNAIGGELLLPRADHNEAPYRASAGVVDEPLCAAAWPGEALGCPAYVGQRGIVLQGPRREWPPSCRRHSSAVRRVVHCLPLAADGKPIGVVRLQYPEGGLSPPTRHLVVLLAMAGEAARIAKQARDILQGAARQDAALIPGRPARAQGAPAANGNITPLVRGTPSRAPEGDSDAPLLDVRCFGAFELYRQGRLLPPGAVSRRSAITLLKILLVNLGRAVSRDFLAECLWPAADPSVTANRVYVLIHALRRAVEPSPGRRPWVFIRNDGDRYYFATEAPFRLDLQEFRRLVDAGERLEREGSPRPASDAYNAALNLYRGDLLEEEPYAEWCWAERENLREKALSVSARLATQYLKWGALDWSIRCYQRALRLDPLREQNHRGLMEALLLAGRRAEALRQYARCKELLRRELNIDPQPETQRLLLLASERRPQS